MKSLMLCLTLLIPATLHAEDLRPVTMSAQWYQQVSGWWNAPNIGGYSAVHFPQGGRLWAYTFSTSLKPPTSGTDTDALWALVILPPISPLYSVDRIFQYGQSPQPVVKSVSLPGPIAIPCGAIVWIAYASDFTSTVSSEAQVSLFVNASASVDWYNPATNTWIALPPVP